MEMEEVHHRKHIKIEETESCDVFYFTLSITFLSLYPDYSLKDYLQLMQSKNIKRLYN